MTRLLNLWDHFRTGFWFVPGLMTVAAILAGLGMPWVDAAFGDAVVKRAPWLQTTPASAGRTLSAFGGAIATATGVVFSTTMVVLSLASQQFGPRLLRTFLSDRTTQVTLGAFVGTSLYTLLVMRVIREVEGNPVAPDLSVHLSILLSVLTICQLVLFIHHLAVKIQASEVIRSVASDLDDAIDRLFPEEVGRGGAEQERGDEPRTVLPAIEGRPVAAKKNGYLQGIDSDGLMELATGRGLVLELPKRPGEFISIDETLAVVRPAAKFDDGLADDLRGRFLLGSRRTPRQDVECSIWELAEVAVRALSPGTNDPFTAMGCLNYLGAAVGRLARREFPSPDRYDGDGNLRIVAKPPTFGSAIDAAFNQIRQYGRTHADVTIRLLEVLTQVAGRTTTAGQCEAVRRHADMVYRGVEALPEPDDRAVLRERYARCVAALEAR